MGRHAIVAIFIVASSAGTIPSSLAGTPGEGELTLPEALRLARARNPGLRGALQEVEIARGRLVKARYPSQFNPIVGGEVGHREQNEPGESGSTRDVAVTLSQEIEVVGQRSARIREAEQAVARAEAQGRDRERLLDSEVKASFFHVLAAARRLELVRGTERLTRRVRDAAGERVRAGEVPPLEENLAAIRLGQARKETYATEAEKEAALLALRRLLDYAPDAPLEPVGELRTSTKAIVLEDALARALAARPDLAAAGREVERVDAERSLTRRLAFPNPTLEGFYREEEFGPDRIAGGGISIPLPLFDRRQGELVALAAQHSQARAQVDALRRAIEQEVGESFRRYEAAARTLAAFEEDVVARVDKSFGLIETAYEAGKIDLFQLIVVQNDLVTAQLSYLDALAGFREAEVALEQAMGVSLDG